MIGDSVISKIIRSNFERPKNAFDLRLSLVICVRCLKTYNKKISLGRGSSSKRCVINLYLFLVFDEIKLAFQFSQSHFLIFNLRSAVLTSDRNSRWYMRNSNGAFNFVDVLPAGSAGAHRVNLQVP